MEERVRSWLCWKAYATGLELAVHFELAEDGLYVAARHRARTHAELPGDVFRVLAAWTGRRGLTFAD